MHLASLNASKSREMNDKGLVLDGQRGVESYERGEKVGLKTNLETRNDNNLAKLNDAKKHHFCSFFSSPSIDE